MEELKVWLELAKIYGLPGIFLAVLIWDKFFRKTGKDLPGRVEVVEEGLKSILRIVEDHLEKEALEDLRIERMHMNIHNLEAQVDRENKHIFSQLESLHEKSDKIMSILVQQK